MPLSFSPKPLIPTIAESSLFSSFLYSAIFL